MQELNKCKTELQYWRSKSPAIPVCFGCGQSIPVPTEDLQALANQGVLSNVEASVNEGLDFIPIPDMEVHSPTEREIDDMLGIPPLQQQQHQPLLNSCSSSSSTSGSSSSTSNSGGGTSNCSINSPLVEPMAPPKAPPFLSVSQISSLPLISSKRKASSFNVDENSAKKPRRAHKARQAKRTKV